MSRTQISIGISVLAAALLYRFPLFHIVPIERSMARQPATDFNAREFAQTYWQSQLVNHLVSAHDAATVFAALNTSPQQAHSEFGRTVGLGRSRYFLIRGGGRIASIENNAIGLALSDDAGDPEVLLSTGPFFGNAVRDATGLLKASDFAQSRQFNDVAAELNLLAENRVGKPLAKKARVGQTVRFVGCFELGGDTLTTPLKVIPLEAEVK